MPLQDACYVASLDKIFGTMGTYVLQFNATTGAREASVRVYAPAYGDCRMCYHAATGLLYVGVWNEMGLQWFNLPHPGRDVYPVNPITMTVGTRLDLIVNLCLFVACGLWSPAYNMSLGPRWMGSAGNYLYTYWQSESGGGLLRYNPANLADRNLQTASQQIFWNQQCGMSATGVYVPDAWNLRIATAPILFNTNADWNHFHVSPYNPIAVEWCPVNSKPYILCGDSNMLRNDAHSTNTIFDLSTVQFDADPCRIRYNSYDQKLYLPCMTSNGIIVWDPALETGTFKSGFENPVDVVFTPSKVFAVQNSLIGLKEVV